MQRICKINGGSSIRELDDSCLWSQYINTRGSLAYWLFLLGGRIAPRNPFRIRTVPSQELTHPGNFLFVLTGGYLTATWTRLFVAPMRGHAIFSKMMHFLGPDLHLKAAPRSEERRVGQEGTHRCDGAAR